MKKRKRVKEKVRQVLPLQSPKAPSGKNNNWRRKSTCVKSQHSQQRITGEPHRTAHNHTEPHRTTPT